MELDAVMLARIQFGFTVAFHIIFPSFTIGLSAWIATLEGIWLKTGDERYHVLARFWTKIFAVSFAMGVVSGIVLSYQFGTNWSGFSEIVGNVVAPLIGYEVLTAFFLEATFLGIMLFGWNRVPKWLHFTACLAVAVGTLMSAFWILSANSWMHYPTGHVIRDGIAYPENWLHVIFNPTFPLRLTHMVIAAYLTTAIVILGVGARYLLTGIHVPYARIMVGMGLGLAIILAPLQVFVGDQHGLKTAKYQPAKLAAMEAHWDGSKPGDLVLFAIPDEENEKNDFEISIPNGASLIITHDINGLFPGLKDFKKEDRPPVLIPFFGFRVMVGIGVWFLILCAWGAIRWWKGTLFDTGLYLTLAWWSWPLGFVAILAGWFTTEVGRQPWIATGVLRTADAASPVSALQVAISLGLFVVVYGIVFTAGVYYINRLIHKGPDKSVLKPEDHGSANRPISGAESAGREVLGSGA